MPTKKKTTTTKKAPVKRTAAKKKTPAKRKPAAKKKAPVKKQEMRTPPGLCVNCMPMGHTQVFAILMVSVFALASVLTIATYKLQVQGQIVDAQAHELQVLKAL